MFVCKLRKKLISFAGNVDMTPKIRTVWGRGYMIHLGRSEDSEVRLEVCSDSTELNQEGYHSDGNIDYGSDLEINLKQG